MIDRANPSQGQCQGQSPVPLGIDAPREITVHRGEIQRQRNAGNVELPRGGAAALVTMLVMLAVLTSGCASARTYFAPTEQEQVASQEEAEKQQKANDTGMSPGVAEALKAAAAYLPHLNR